MERRAIYLRVALAMLPCLLLSQPASAADPQIAAQFEQLKSADSEQVRSALQALVKIGKPAVPGLVALLKLPQADVRARAAQALREILAANPTAASNDNGEAYWQARVKLVRKGMTPEEVRKLLAGVDLGGAGSGSGVTAGYRLDDYWEANVYFWEGIVARPPLLYRHIKAEWVEPPKSFSGVWVDWYVNGQKYEETEYQGGQCNGPCISYYDDGARCYERQYRGGQPQGLEIGWHPNGRKSYEGSYEDGKLVGTWTHWFNDGQLESTENFKAGKLDGLATDWYANGQKQYEVEYRAGVKHGLDRAWDETGKLLWDRRNENGKPLEPK